MRAALNEQTELRVLLRTATARDAIMAGGVLRRAGFSPVACPDFQNVVEEIDAGAGVLVVAEEALDGAGAAGLAEALSAQPAWSDLPVLMLARQGANSRTISGAMDLLGNLTVLERPLRVASMVSALRSALRARRRQYELRGMLDDLRLADQRKTEFLATLAHELRNPMAPVKNVLTILRRESPDAEAAKPYYDMMARQLDHMVRLVNELMEISRITRGRIELQLADVALEQVVREAVELSRPLLDASRHQLDIRQTGAALSVRGDAVRLTQVFANLLNNAAKYTPPGGQVEIHLSGQGNLAVVAVQDNGAGIAPDMRGSIFDMFVQVNGTDKVAQGGLGIGLTLVKTLVELHGGTVGVTSGGLGHGSRFEVRLPLLGAQRQPMAEGPADDVLPFSGFGPILIVDDNRDAADSLRLLLQVLGGDTAVAYDGAQALRVAAAIVPSVAILDIGMPGMDGCDLARQLRAHPVHAGMTLIALTGWGQENDRQRITEAGFDHHLLKPVDVRALTLAFAQLRAPIPLA